MATARGRAGDKFKGVVSKLIELKNELKLTSDNNFSQEEEFEMSLQLLEEEKRIDENSGS